MNGFHPNAPGAPDDAPPRGQSAGAVSTRLVLPHSIEAERSVLGGVLVSPKAYTQIADVVTPDDFYHPAHRAMYEAMIDLDEAGCPIDPITVAEKMRANDTFGKLRAVNGEAYFVDLMSNVVTIENIAFHGRMVRGKATVRRLIEVAQEIAAHGYGEYGDLDEYIAKSEASVLAVTTRRGLARPVRLGAAAKAAYKVREDIANGKREAPGVASSVQPLFNATLNGYRAGRVYLIAGFSSSGKSALVMQELAFGSAPDAATGSPGHPSLAISLEMDEDQLAVRAIAGASEVAGTRFDKAQMTAAEWLRAFNAVEALDKLDVEISRETSLRDIVATIRRWHAERMREHEARCRRAREADKPEPALPTFRVAIDYVQLVEGERQRGETETNEQVHISVTLTRLATSLPGLCMILVGQYKKSYDGSREPTENDIYGAGQFVKDAHVVVLLHYESKDKHQAIRPTLAIVAKNRGGETGKVLLDFHRRITRFVESRDNELPESQPAQRSIWHPNAPDSGVDEDR